MPRLRAASAMALAGLVLSNAPTQAQFISSNWADEIFVDPSIRSQGMGGASGAVFWGESPNDWANPALLGYRRGFQYEFAELDNGSLGHVSFGHVTVGFQGLAVSFAGRPFGFGGSDRHLNWYSTDDAFWTGHTRHQGIGVGLNVLEFAAFALRPVADVPEWHRWGDISFAMLRITRP